MTKLERKAARIGRERGKAAASWVFDGNTSDDTYRRVLKGLDDLDPAVLDGLPQSPLSGEWADAYTVKDLADEMGVNVASVDLDELADAFEAAWYDAVHESVYKQASEHLKAGV